MSGQGEDKSPVTEDWESASLKVHRVPGRRTQTGEVGPYQSSQETRVLKFHASEYTWGTQSS
jgi:hypothetical protein